MKAIPVPVFPVAAAMAILLIPQSRAQSPEDLATLSRSHRGLSFVIQAQGPVERMVSGQSSGDLSSWSPTGTVTEVLRGFYQFVDSDVAGTSSRLYRLADSGPVVPGAWADTYPVTPLNWQNAGIVPRFEWMPYPGPPGIDYELNVYEFEPAPGGRLILPSAPLLTVPGLIDTHYEWSAGDPDLKPTNVYAWTVTANVFGAQDIGNANFFIPFGGDGNSQPTDWAKLMELVKDMQDELARLKSELGSNPLIAEIQLIERLIQILGNYDLFKDYVTAILNNEIDKLIDSAVSVDTLKKVLCFLEDAAEIIALDHPDGSATKNALNTFKNGVKGLKERIETAENLASELADIWNDLEQLGQDLRSVITDPVTFFLDAAKDAFKDKLKSILIRKFGEAAAGSLMSIAINLAVFAEALITLNSIQTLELQINALLKSAIANSASRDVFNPNGSFVFPLQPGQENCDITIAFKKLCFHPTPDPGDSDDAGTWGPPAPVPYADGSTSKTMKGGDFPTTFAYGINNPYKICSTPKMPVPCTEGPCIIYVEVTISCPGRPSRTHRIFAGVVKGC